MSKNQKSCYIDDCPADPVVVCNCVKKPILICKNHGIDHCQTKGKHHFEKICMKIHEEAKNESLKQLYKLKSDIKLCKSKIIQEELSLIIEIQKVSQKALKDLKLQEQKLNQYIYEIFSLKEIDNFNEVNSIESLLKSSNDLPEIQFIKSLELEINHISSDYTWQLYEKISEQQINLGVSVHEIKYIWSGPCIELNIFNTKTLKEDKIKLQLPKVKKLNQYGAKCFLPDGSLFYDHGAVTIIIDPKYNIKTLQTPSWKSENACAVYKDGEIYLFGGASDRSIKFSLPKNTWTRLLNMPINLGNYTSGAVFKNYILLGSIHSDKILYYDTDINSFNEILSLNLTSSTAKAFFVENETVYFIDFSKNIYRSTDNLGTWANIGSCSILSGNAPIISTPVTYNQKVYFVNYYGIYSFDLRQEKIEKIKTLA